ncbi:antitoxin Xre/MbcA/ParS toxin-binding domain-containing protein [Caulobacter sp.]|uniref:antitoxin Xre/MbcA/ParS toxin-binding domain-containing protein n=1 Tax=Caulobacter sp. TaxID=78 RepID=UPI0016081E54
MPRQNVTAEALLGIEGLEPASPWALAHSIEAGLPVAALEQFTEIMAPDDALFKYRLVPKATLQRRKKSTGRLTTDEGDRLVRLARVFSFAIEIYGSPDRAREFLRRPHTMLGGKPPLDVALTTSPGTDLVINLLGRLAYGGTV